MSVVCISRRGAGSLDRKTRTPCLHLHNNTADIFDILYDNEFVDIFDVFHIQSTHIIYIEIYMYFQLAECFEFFDLKSRVS